MAADLPSVVNISGDPVNLLSTDAAAAVVLSSDEATTRVVSETHTTRLLTIGIPGPPGMLSSGYRAHVEPAGAKNGVNTTFTFPDVPLEPTFEFYQNGLLESPDHYTLIGNILTLTTAPQSWWRLAASYFV